MEGNMNLFNEAISCLTVIEHNVRKDTLDLSYLAQLYERVENVMSTINSSKMVVLQYQPSLDSIMDALEFHKSLLKKLCDQQSGVETRLGARCSADNREGEARSSVINDMIITLRNDDLNGLDAIIGVQEAKQTLKEACILPLQYPHLFQGAVRPWRRILLYGPPGTGKTLLAKGIASELNRDLYYVSSASLLSSWIGESEKLVRELFLKGREKFDQCIIFIDEIDSLCRSRTQTEDEHSRRVKTELLRQLEGVSSSADDELFVLAATNCPWDIDHAFLRRFQRRIFVNLPNGQERKTIIEKLLGPSSNFFWKEEELVKILELTEGYSGADLTHLVNATVIQPIRELSSNRFWSISKDVIRPSRPDDRGSIECRLEDLPNDRVVARSVEMKDFYKAVESTPRTVSDNMIQKYSSFSKGNY